MLTAKTPYCPSHEDLADFAAGTVTAERLETLSAHIDTCVVCQATIAELSDSADSFVAALRTSQGVVEEESACRQALEQMLNQRGRVAASGKPSVSLPEFVGPYRVLEPIAAGGMGMVLRAQHPKLKRTVAIKLLPLQQWAGSTAVARFEREMEVIGNLDHPNIVRASDAGDAGGMHYLVMDFIDGTDLSQLVHRLGPLPVADACEIARQTAIGLQYVHDAGLVHRDIKPSNIMLTGDGRVKILDLGLAMLNEQFSEDANNLTTVGQLMGTLDYMSPEQAADSRQVDARADIYSLGATLFKLLTGQAPYGGPTHRSLLKKVLALASGPVPSVCAVRADVPIELDQLVQRCLDKSIESRFTRVAEVAEALAPLAATAQLSALAHEAVQRAHRDPAETPSWNWVPRDVDQPSESTAQAAKPLPKPAKPRKLITAIVGVAALALLIACGVLIRIATDRGELIVRSDDPHAQIRITRVADQSVEDIAVEKGEKRTVVKSGEYTVELLGDGDDWTLSPTRFTMQRGGQKVLQVQRGPLPSDSSDATGLLGSGGMGMPGMGGMGSGWAGMGGMPGGSGGGSGMGGMMGSGGYPVGGNLASPGMAGRITQSTYDGKYYEEWMSLIESERSPARLLEAVNAIQVIMPKGDDERVARSLLRAMQTFGSDESDGSPEGKLVEATDRLLFQLDPTSVGQAIVAELPNTNERAARFLGSYFAGGFQGKAASYHWQKAMAAAAPQIASRAFELAENRAAVRNGEANADSIALLTLAAALCTNIDVDVSKIEGFLPRFRQALKSDNDNEALAGACILVQYEPDTKGIAEVVVRIGDRRSGPLGSPVNLLEKLGPRAESVVPSLVDDLFNNSSDASSNERRFFAQRALRSIGEPAIPYLQAITDRVDARQASVIASVLSQILARRNPSNNMMPGLGSMMPGAGSMMPGSGGSMMPGAGSMMPGSGGSMMPGSGLPSTTVPGEDTASPDAENKETPGTSDGTSQAPANALPGGSLGSGAGSSGSLPGESGGVSDGVGTQETYDGRSYDDWMKQFATERNPVGLAAAVDAVRILMPKGDDERVARTVLGWMRNWDWPAATGESRTFVNKAESLFRSLDPVRVLQAVHTQLPRLNDHQADFLSECFHAAFRPASPDSVAPSATRDDWQTVLRTNAPQFVEEALKLSNTTDGTVDTSAMLMIAETLTTVAGLDVSKIDGFLPRFREALRSEDDRAVLAAASVMVIHEPDTEGLAEVVIRFLNNDGDGTRALQLLCRLGPHAKPVVPTLIDKMVQAKDRGIHVDLPAMALAHIGSVAYPILEAAREQAHDEAKGRIEYAMALIQKGPTYEPYGTIPGWNRSKDSAAPTDAAPPQESGSATPNGDVKQSDEAETGGDSNTPSPSTDKDSQ